MSDAVLQELIVRLASDEGFAGEVRARPATLDAFDLTAEERATLLSLGADSGAGATGLAERQSKSSLLFMGAGHHVEGHVNLNGPGLESHAHGAVNPAALQHDIKLDTSLGADKHFTGPITHDIKLDTNLGADKHFTGPITHDAKLDTPLGADKYHGAMGDGSVHDKISLSSGGDAKLHDAGLSSAKMTDVGDAKLHGLGADKWHDAGLNSAKMTDVGDVKLHGLGADKMDAGLNNLQDDKVSGAAFNENLGGIAEFNGDG